MDGSAIPIGGPQDGDGPGHPTACHQSRTRHHLHARHGCEARLKTLELRRPMHPYAVTVLADGGRQCRVDRTERFERFLDQAPDSTTQFAARLEDAQEPERCNRSQNRYLRHFNQCGRIC
jgi:hypothetical protein